MATLAYLDIDQGSDFTVVMTLETDDGNPMNLGGYQVHSQFRKSYNSVIGYTFQTVIVDAANGLIELRFSGVDSSNLRPGRYLYDVEIYNVSAQRKTRVVEGIVTINPEITKIP
jgi:hypothetical protein